MELFIRVDENRQAVDHPIMGDNFRQAFPDIDVSNLPNGSASAIKITATSWLISGSGLT